MTNNRSHPADARCIECQNTTCSKFYLDLYVCTICLYTKRALDTLPFSYARTPISHPSPVAPRLFPAVWPVESESGEQAIISLWHLFTIRRRYISIQQFLKILPFVLVYASTNACDRRYCVAESMHAGANSTCGA